ncbi:MAG TPA: SWIM zinc finger family protein, partial [Candidatus Binatia bacterium]|nr:SWIM zinc finger family protein [Candidatus Binatia bacterium]
MTDELSAETAPITQKRGRTYFAHGAVRLLDTGERAVSARVQGSQVYRVKLTVADGFLDYSCTCPFFTGDLNACKHIWATAMAAEERGCLKKILDSDDHRNSRNAGGLPPGSPQHRTRPGKQHLPGWKQQLQSIRHALAPALSPFNDRPPPERELYYLI